MCGAYYHVPSSSRGIGHGAGLPCSGFVAFLLPSLNPSPCTRLPCPECVAALKALAARHEAPREPCSGAAVQAAPHRLLLVERDKDALHAACGAAAGRQVSVDAGEGGVELGLHLGRPRFDGRSCRGAHAAAKGRRLQISPTGFCGGFVEPDDEATIPHLMHRRCRAKVPSPLALALAAPCGRSWGEGGGKWIWETLELPAKAGLRSSKQGAIGIQGQTPNDHTAQQQPQNKSIHAERAPAGYRCFVSPPAGEEYPRDIAHKLGLADVPKARKMVHNLRETK